MELMKVIEDRRSIRAYKNKEVETEKLNSVLEAGRLAPSANNRQEWGFIVVRDKEKIQKLAVASKNQKFVAEAPIVLVACGTEIDNVMTCGQPTYALDVSIAFSFMMLEATNQGLGTCWLGAFYEDQVKEILEIPNNIRVVAMTPLGYPDSTPSERPRKSIEQIISYDKF